MTAPDPHNTIDAQSLVIFSSVAALSSQQLIEVETTGEFSPAIFTVVRAKQETAINMQRTFQIIVPLILSSLFLLAACTEPVSTPVSTATESKVCPESAQQFWKKFRSAVLKEDMNALADMTQFPLEVGGDMDNNPKKFVYRKNFNKHFTQLLSYELNSDYLPITPRPASMKELARAVTEPPSCGKRGDYFYLGTFVFLLNPEGWRLVKVHSNEFMYAETEEPLHTTPPKE